MDLIFHFGSNVHDKNIEMKIVLIFLELLLFTLIVCAYTP
jgi:hypothetical protein